MSFCFSRGQRVVCVQPSWDADDVDYYGNRWPMFNMVYVIRGFCEDELTKEVGMWLEEIVNKPLPCLPDGHLGEIAFPLDCFRPVRETSIDCFVSLLTPLKSKENA